MSGGLVDDYLAQLLAAAAAPEPELPEPEMIVPAPPPSNPDEISDAEFEALLDALHGGQPPGAAAPVSTPVAPVVRAAPGAAPGATVATVPEARDAELRAADAESWRGQERRASRRSSRWLRLRVHQQDYAVELLKVQEVLLPVEVLPMRDTDPAILGIMNLRGVVVPVLDLGLWLGLEEVEASPQARYVVLEQNADCIALKVSAVLDVHAIADGQIEPPEHTLAAPGAGMLQGVARLSSQPVILLDAAGLLG